MFVRNFSRKLLSNAPGSHTPSSMYEWLVKSGSIRHDSRQVPVMKALDKLHHDLISYTPDHFKLVNNGALSYLHRFIGGSGNQRPTPKGLYIYGSPGTGKTLLMDIFYDCALVSRKKRVHFNSFMVNVHERIHHWRLTRDKDVADCDPIPPLAHSIGSEAHLICFDEFQVTDIADAMIIKRLFDKLFSYGVVFIFTSNRAPNELYKNGIQREQFLSFIDQLCSKCEILNLDSHVDYRKEGVSLSGTFFFPLKEKQEEFFNAFRLLTDNRTPKSKTVAVGQGRDLNIPSTVNGVALFNFEDLCDVALGSADYAAIASNFHTLFLEGVPKFSVESRNVLRRFIVLVDELYQMKVRLICLAACKPEELFRPESKSEAYDEVFAFHRCLSRLIEMQSKEYIVAGDLKRKKRSADKDEI